MKMTKLRLKQIIKEEIKNQQLNEFLDPMTAGLIGALAMAILRRPEEHHVHAEPGSIAVGAVSSTRMSMLSMGLGELLAMAGLGAAAAGGMSTNTGGIKDKLKNLWDKLRGTQKGKEIEDSIKDPDGEGPAEAPTPRDAAILVNKLESNEKFKHILYS